MNKIRILPIAAALTLMVAGAANASNASLLPAQKGDLVPQTLRTVPTAPATASLSTAAAPATPSIDHRPVHVSWKLDAQRALEAAPKPFDRNSREYWQDVSADELHHGLQLRTSAPGALVRLSPVGGSFGQLDPQRMQVVHGGRTLTGTQAMSNSADASQLRQAGMMVSDGSMVMKLRPDLGPGPVTLKADDAKGRYVVHVYEPQSPMVLHAQTDRDTIASGQSVRLNVHLRDDGANRAMDAVGGYLVAPDGHTRNLSYQRHADGSYTVDVTPDADHATRPGLWELHTFTSATDASGQTVLRDATTAFAVSVTDAKLSGAVQVKARGKRGIDVMIGVDAVQASRYAVSGVLYGQAADGSMKPMAYAQSADWLQAGNGTIDLRFDAGALAGSGLQAPYELRDLKLVDQAHMGILERRAVALRFSP
ncbi:DUF4785 domain-containing protein [Oleiagrimonas soli]|uniref:DUF4785 domain-containing protein n=1 Tax=Oleiagrimonas soli TaxID=1543381 RepID=A0A099CWX8_9GAMM|nr:DUF4785 domain-containing protein [Oleiagrimonas soli]KGI78142.1 hypothetical protein LF63_0107305 [Oleiagrimonas soli]MBB6183407.1 hypothetical protein [Oleiagrimonas soli]